MPDALQILREDHKKVKEMFRQFEDAEDRQTKKSLADQAILELTVHANLEEAIFYPAVRREGGTGEMVDEAEEEHHVAEVLMDELRGMKQNGQRWEAKFKVLAENVKHHIEEEESQTLPKAAELGPEALQRIGQQMEMRRPSLMQQAQRMGSSRRTTSRSTSGTRSRSTSGTRSRSTSGSRSRSTSGTRSRYTSGTRTRSTSGTRSRSTARRTTRTVGKASGGRSTSSRGSRTSTTRARSSSRNGAGRGRTTRTRSTSGSRGIRARSTSATSRSRGSARTAGVRRSTATRRSSATRRSRSRS